MAPNENLGFHLSSRYNTQIHKSAHILNNQTFKIETPKNTKLRPSSFDLVKNSILGKMT